MNEGAELTRNSANYTAWNFLTLLILRQGGYGLGM
jgi:hypothetical protein